MNFEKLFTWIAGIVIAAALAGHLDTLQAWVWKAQAKTIQDARTSNWGSPRFFPNYPLVKPVHRESDESKY